jgi:hypothetical protein
VRNHVMCQSIRTIEPGEELTADYRFSHRAPKLPCRCGSSKCRGTINSPKDSDQIVERKRRRESNTDTGATESRVVPR